jgi:phenylacetaldehyde dehydrogenase
MTEMQTISREQLAYSAAAQAFLARRPQLFIGNEWVDSSAGATIAVEDPSTGREITRIVDASDADIDRAVAAARAAFDDGRWSDLPPIQREEIMHRLADLLAANTDEFAELEAIDNGKPKSIAAKGDIPSAVRTIRYMAGWPTKLGVETVEPSNFPRGKVHAYVRREPVGVVASIVPWNFPLMMAVQKLAPALAAGCTIVLKPAEQTSLTALRLADLIAEAGFPAGVVNIITGNGHTAGDRMVRHPDVDKVAFTGSTEIGKLILRNGAENLKRITLELGGKSPVIVLPDTDVGGTAGAAARAIFYNSGQVCVAGSRIYAHRSIFDELLEGIAATAPRWAPRPSLDPEAMAGPLVSREQLDRVMGYVDAGRKSGASVMIGGDAAEASGGYYFNPTILTDVKPGMSVVEEEIFGPVVVAQRFDDLDEVAKAANATCYGLGASIWTRDVSTLHRLAAKIKSGSVWGNCHSAIDIALPFGGYKQSGLGREGSREGVEAYTELKTVVVQL